jgi:hypothetical protein
VLTLSVAALAIVIVRDRIIADLWWQWPEPKTTFTTAEGKYLYSIVR